MLEKLRLLLTLTRALTRHFVGVRQVVPRLGKELFHEEQELWASSLLLLRTGFRLEEEQVAAMTVVVEGVISEKS